MSKSPKSLSTLASSLSLSSISRARSTGTGHVAKYTIRHAPGGAVVVARSRPASASPPTVGKAGRNGSSAASGNGSRDGTGLLRSGNSAGSSGPRSLERQLHTSSRSAHQQPIPSSSSSINPPIVPPSSHASSEASFHPRPASLPASENSLLLNSHQPSIGGPSVSSTSAEASTSASSTSTNSNTTNSTNSSDRATLFTSNHPTSFPSHSLPAFFGTSLNIARRSNLVFRNGAYGIPKAGNKDKGKEKEKLMIQAMELNDLEYPLSVSVGEDAYFLRTDSLGVADGVGGWSGHAGANPARWSRKLMHHCSAELARYDNVEDELFLRYYEIDPVEVLQRAFEKCLVECKSEGLIGSSTALLAVLRNDELRLANMGDCCCSIIRGNDYIFRSEEQQHSFNYPVQVGTNSKDTPLKDAQRFNIKVQKDDIVILSSDGLLDNIFDNDLLEEVNRFVAASRPSPSSTPAPGSSPSSRPPRYTLNQFSPQAVSEALSRRAQSVYEDPHAVASPFQQRAVDEGIYFTGGKRDDITTLVGVVGELEASPDRR